MAEQKSTSKTIKPFMEMTDANSISNAELDIETGLSLLATLSHFLHELIVECNDAGNKLTAAAALAEKAGAILERGVRSAGILQGPGIVGGPEDWIGI